VTNLRVFGSVARGQDRPDSDVDLLADLPPGMGLLGLGRVQAELEDILGTRVDLIAGTLKPEVRARADRDLVPLVTYRERQRHPVTADRSGSAGSRCAGQCSCRC